MKRYFILFFFFLIAVHILEARTFVLATGVSNYGNESANLSQTTKDVKRFKEVMDSQTQDITILTSKNVTHDNVLEKLRAICKRAQIGDRVIFYYSGHGMTGGICAYDYPILYEDIVKVLSTSKASEKICFIDACHAGSVAQKGGNEAWTKSVKGASDQAFFVSSRADEYSIESSLLGAGYFTQALLKGLRGKADTNANREVTVIELFKYIYRDVVRRSKEGQHPQLIAPRSMYDIVVTKW